MANVLPSPVEMQFYTLRPWYRSFSHHDLLIAFVPILLVLYFWNKTWPARFPQLPKGTRRPLLYPSIIPSLSHLLLMAWNSPRFISAVTTRFSGIPVQLQLLFTEIYVISGPDIVREVWKEPDLHNKAYKALSVQNMCKMPKDTLAFWMEDDSGHHSQPRLHSQVPHHLRADYHTHSAISKFLTGDGLRPFARRYTANLTKRLSAIEALSPEWSNLPDLFGFLQVELFPAAVEAMWCKRFFAVNPTFTKDFWEFSKFLPGLAKRYPRWLYSKHYQARDKCFASIKKWHAVIQSSFDNPKDCTDNWNEDYGADLIRYRHMAWSKMPRMGADGAATEDLGMVWAVNANSIPASYWMITEVIRDPALLAQVRSIIDSYRIVSETSNIDFAYAELCADPLLQSIYAETLRLHVAAFIMRGPARADFSVKGWHIPKDSVMLMSSYNAQTDPRGWSTDGGPPAHETLQFWAERFLAYPNSITDDALTSPESENPQSQVSRKPTYCSNKSAKPEYSLKGRSAHWFPYGGGQRMCPGRHFAKQEMISSLAIMLTMFDIELAEETSRIPENDMAGFGFGALWPNRETPVRIRRRTR